MLLGRKSRLLRKAAQPAQSSQSEDLGVTHANYATRPQRTASFCEVLQHSLDKQLGPPHTAERLKSTSANYEARLQDNMI